MTNYAPKEPGDVICTQHPMIQSLPIKSGVSIRKGHIYALRSGTDNASNGYLQALTVSGGAFDLTMGIYQAMANHAAPSPGDAYHKRLVQCLMSPPYIIMYAPAGIVRGQHVKLAAPTATSADTNKVEALEGSESSTKTGYLGLVHKIYTKTPSGETVKETADGDKIIETGLVWADLTMILRLQSCPPNTSSL